MNLLIRIAVFVLIGLSLFVFISITNPYYSVNDLYLLTENCVDIQYEGGYGKYSNQRVYILTDTGKRYYVYDDIWGSLDDSQKDLIGKNITFYASDKGSHWLYDYLLISFGNDGNDYLTSLKSVNKTNIQTQVIVISLYCVIFGLFFIGPEALRESERKKVQQRKRQKDRRR